MDLVTIDQVMEFAIAAEIDAARRYVDLAHKVDRPELRELLLLIASEEEAHRETLESVREGNLAALSTGSVDVELSVPLAAPQLGPDLTAPQFLLAAIDAERRACQLYSELASRSDDPGLATVLMALAGEETNHWMKLEKAYEEYVGL